MQHARTAELIDGLNAVEAKYAPETLWYAGDVGLLRQAPRVAVIGSRIASANSLALAREVAGRIARMGGVVVSGLAAGVDTAAHTAAIQEGGRTIAVLGTPLDRAYPAANRELQFEIMRDHLAVSQFAPGRSGGPKNFVMRNRTMALLSHASVVIAAGAKSGTEHQGWEAIRLGRPLIFHGAVLAGEAAWANKMLEYGAVHFAEVSELADLITELLPIGHDAKDAAIFA